MNKSKLALAFLLASIASQCFAGDTLRFSYSLGGTVISSGAGSDGGPLDNNEEAPEAYLPSDPIYTAWTNHNEPYGCTEWLPLAITVEVGLTFDQTNSCHQDQTRIRQNYVKGAQTGLVKADGDPFAENQTVDIAGKNTTEGVMTVCKFIYNTESSEVLTNAFYLWTGQTPTTLKNNIVWGGVRYSSDDVAADEFVSGGFKYSRGAEHILSQTKSTRRFFDICKSLN